MTQVRSDQLYGALKTTPIHECYYLCIPFFDNCFLYPDLMFVVVGEEDSEVSGECEAPPTSRPRLTEASETNNTANHVNDNHQPAIDLTDDAPKVNGISNGYESDSNGVNEDDEMPPVPPIKELSPEELAEKMKLVRRLQVELRNEEMKLVLLKKVRQSQVRPAATASRVLILGGVIFQNFRTQVNQSLV